MKKLQEVIDRLDLSDLKHWVPVWIALIVAIGLAVVGWTYFSEPGSKISVENPIPETKQPVNLVDDNITAKSNSEASDGRVLTEDASAIHVAPLPLAKPKTDKIQNSPRPINTSQCELTREKTASEILSVVSVASQATAESLFEGRCIPKPGFIGRVISLPSKSSELSTYRVQVREDKTQAVFNISTLDNILDFRPGDKIRLRGRILKVLVPGDIINPKTGKLVKVGPSLQVRATELIDVSDVNARIKKWAAIIFNFELANVDDKFSFYDDLKPESLEPSAYSSCSSMGVSQLDCAMIDFLFQIEQEFSCEVPDGIFGTLVTLEDWSDYLIRTCDFDGLR